MDASAIATQSDDVAGKWERELVIAHPESIPVTEATWRRLPNDLLAFYMLRDSAPTELAARVLLNVAARAMGAGAVISEKALRKRHVLAEGRQLSPGGGRPPLVYSLRIPPCRVERLQSFAGLPQPRVRGVS